MSENAIGGLRDWRGVVPLVLAGALALPAGGCGCGGGGYDAAVTDAGPVCGNTNVDPGEECDDGFMCASPAAGGLTDGCSNDCMLEVLASVAVNTTVETSQIFPVAAGLLNGYVVVYQDANEAIEDRSEIRVRLFDPAGAPWTAGGPFAPGFDFRASVSPASGVQSTPAVSACDDGSFAVAWGDFRPPATIAGAVRARFFAPDGSPAGDDAVISDPMLPGHSFGFGLSGDCLLGAHVFVWQEEVAPMAPMPGGSILRARAFDGAGVPIATDGGGGTDLPFDVEPNALTGARQPSIAVDPVTLSVWVAYASLPSGRINEADVFLRRLSGSLGAIGGVEIVNDVGELTVEGPQIAVAGGGEGAIIVWEERASASIPNLLRARLYDAAASPRPPAGSVDDGPFTLDALFTPDESLPAPSVTALADDTFLVTWVTLEDGVVALNVDAGAAGVGTSPLGVVSDTGTCVLVKGPVAAGAPGGGYLVAWETTSPTNDDNSCGLVGCGVRARVMP